MVTARKRGPPVIATRRRCASCQHKHIKCEYDTANDKCKACQASNKDCVVRHRFQHVDPTAPKRNKHRETADDTALSGNLTFVQERLPVSARRNKEKSPASMEGNHDNDATSTIDSSNTREPDVISMSPKITRPTSRSELSVPTSTSPASSRCPEPSAFLIASPQLPSLYSPSIFDLQSPMSVRTPAAVRSDEKEKAMLLRHFVDVLSRWFDVCDPDQHFKRVVPLKALSCPTLLKAISAAAAWHMCRMGKFERERSNFLYENCLNHLIKAMDSPMVGYDDSVLVAAVIMHHVEELRDLEHTLNLESRGHIIGFNVFLDAQDPDQLSSSLRTAAFRTAIREEMHVCFVDQQPLTLPSEVAKVDRSFGQADDDTWAWRMILIFRDALAYSLSPSSVAEWDALTADQESWLSLRPDTFNPTYSRRPDPSEGTWLPELWFVHDCHTIGAIHYYLCRLVLAVSNPRTPKIGWAKAAAVRRVEDEVKDSVVEICGIAASNNLFPSAMTAASMVVTMCAENITEPSVQGALFEALPRTREIHAWPTEAAQRYVKSVWRAQQETSPTSPRSTRSRDLFLATPV